ncbi:hypothetical protein HOD29_06590 [archaeon]|jgi:hypothetical protein|nr:hypothetical protein [archaeon]
MENKYKIIAKKNGENTVEYLLSAMDAGVASREFYGENPGLLGQGYSIQVKKLGKLEKA